ncbi:hypothetical protein ABBQ32_005259 [Trebouxia sp. C0010 RCD-2024]
MVEEEELYTLWLDNKSNHVCQDEEEEEEEDEEWITTNERTNKRTNEYSVQKSFCTL